MTDHMKTVHDIDTEIALARKEITDLNITQYAVPEKIKGKNFTDNDSLPSTRSLNPVPLCSR